MSSQADELIQAVHTGFDQLAQVVENLTPEQLTGPSAASEWTIADVLSHLGSGAVISLATLERALTGAPAPSNQAIWDHWNALPPAQQAADSLAANRDLNARYDSVDAATRETLMVDMGFLPEPVPFAVPVRFRLSELTLHSWDVRVAIDPRATLEPSAVPLLFPHLEFMFGFIAKPATLAGRTLAVELHDPASSFGVSFGDAIVVGDPPANPDATLTLPAESWVRLATGRLAPQYTPDDAQVTGSITFDEVRAVFPGF